VGEKGWDGKEREKGKRKGKERKVKSKRWRGKEGEEKGEERV
jgi:hypothetical protein